MQKNGPGSFWRERVYFWRFCGALLTGYLGITDLSRFLLFVIAGGGGAIMGLVLAMVLTARGKRFGRKMEEARAQLSELLAGIWETEPYPRRPWMRFMAVWQSFQSFVICWTSLSMRWIIYRRYQLSPGETE